MKQIIGLTVIILLIAGCRDNSQVAGDSFLAPDISDLAITKNVLTATSARRNKLSDKIDEGMILIRSDYGYSGGLHENKVANHFYYLTALAQPGSALMITKGTNKPFKLFVTDRSLLEIIFNGAIPGTEELMDTYQADTVLQYASINAILEENIKDGRSIYIDFQDTILHNSLSGMIKRLGAPTDLLKDINPFIAEMRVYKDTLEIERLKKAIAITGEAFLNASRACYPDMFEFEIEALIEYEFRKSGSSMPGFRSIVAFGPNTTILHYELNNSKMNNGDLLLMDVGAEYGYYTADISRTIPVNGRFTEEQKQIYELVLKAQKAAIEEMVPGNHVLSGNHKASDIIIQGLAELGLITDVNSDWQKQFYIVHGYGHYLGMDVHDVGDYGIPDTTITTVRISPSIKGRPLEEGMVLTIEPGLYFRENGLEQLYMFFENEATHEEIQNFITEVSPIYEKYINIGVRIEDDILITEDGNINLSVDIPKEIDEIEKIMTRK